MKKCLFITTQFPYPLDNGGKIGAYNGLRVVSANYDITVLSFSEEQQYIEEGINFFKTKLPNVTFDRPIKHDIHIRNRPLKLAKVMSKNFLQNIPYITMKFKNINMFKLIDNKFENNKFWDIVFIDYLNMGIYQEYIQKEYNGQYGTLILKDHNIEYEIIKQAAFNEIGIKKIILHREWKMTKKYEEKSIKLADVTFSVCDANTEFLKKYNENSYTMLPIFNILPERVQLHTNNILYIGNLSWKANFEGLKWFIDKVMPNILNVIPDAKLTIVGSGPNKNVFNKYSFVSYLGYVKDITHIYDTQSVFIVPLFEGSGIRIKILEAFNNEIAVVSTELGCKTIGVKNNQEIIIANDSVEFAEGVIKLLSDPIVNDKMVETAKTFLKNYYSLEIRQREFIEVLNGKN